MSKIQWFYGQFCQKYSLLSEEEDRQSIEGDYRYCAEDVQDAQDQYGLALFCQDPSDDEEGEAEQCGDDCCCVDRVYGCPVNA